MLNSNDNYQERLELIADYFAAYELYLGEVTVAKLESWVQQELGCVDGSWRNHDLVLHIISGNTNHAGLQSVLRALLVGGKHKIKLPSQGADQVESCLVNLPAELQLDVNWSRVLNPEWLSTATVVVAYGSDETMQEIQLQLTTQQSFIGHGHKVGMAYVDMTVSQASDDLSEIAECLVKDVVAFNQQGCLSLQVVYVQGSSELRLLLAQEVAATFAKLDDKLNDKEAAHSLDSQELARVAYAREAFSLKSLIENSECQLWSSDIKQSMWTVAMDNQMAVEQLMGDCWLWIKPWDDSIKSELEFLAAAQLDGSHLSSLAIYPYEQSYINRFSSQSWGRVWNRGWDRVCKLGELQAPPLDWKQGNRANLLDLTLA